MSQITKHSIILKMKDKDKYDNEREIEELAWENYLKDWPMKIASHSYKMLAVITVWQRIKHFAEPLVYI